MTDKIPNFILILSTFLVLAMTTFSRAPEAAIIKNLEFNSDGVFPSSDPQITLSNNSGQAENAIFSVSGGMLQQRTLSINGNTSHGFPNGTPSGGSISASESFSLEARVQILGIDGLGGAFFQSLDGVHRYSVFFSTAGVEVLGTSGFDVFAVDTSVFHTYRIESQGGTNAFDFYIDGIHMLNGLAAASTSLNGFNFGDGVTAPGRGADANWDFVRFSQPASEVEVPAPGMLTVMIVGVMILSRRKSWSVVARN